jgi:hypothetical protein
MHSSKFVKLVEKKNNLTASFFTIVEQQLPLTEKAKLQKANLVQVPKMEQWQYKIETLKF